MGKLNRHDNFEQSLRIHGVKMGLNSIGAIGEHLGYIPQTFRKKVHTLYFTFPELVQLFKVLRYTDEEIAEVMT